MTAAPAAAVQGGDVQAVGFYVSVINGSRAGLLLGPYPSQPEACRHVDRARREAETIDPWAGFYGFGTARAVARPGRALPAGKLNSRIGLHPAATTEEGT